MIWGGALCSTQHFNATENGELLILLWVFCDLQTLIVFMMWVGIFSNSSTVKSCIIMIFHRLRLKLPVADMVWLRCLAHTAPQDTFCYCIWCLNFAFSFLILSVPSGSVCSKWGAGLGEQCIVGMVRSPRWIDTCRRLVMFKNAALVKLQWKLFCSVLVVPVL